MFPFKISSREITMNWIKGGKPFLHSTYRLGLVCMPTKDNQNNLKGIKVME